MQQSTTPAYIDISLPTTATTCRVATLGPTGTSSEQAAKHLSRQILADGGQAVPALFHSYEQAAAAVLRGSADLLLVANAYSRISEFYMDTKFALAGAYYFQTPQYGIATAPGTTLAGAVRVASHPAPVPLIEQLLPDGLSVKEVVLVDSTSAAALAVRAAQVDAALTTQPSAERYGLSFVSRTRPIEMLWSVFRLAEAREPVAA